MPKQVSELPKLEWLYTFVLLVEHGTFADTAKQLKQTQQAVSKTLILLESHLQTPLLVRKPWVLTPAGKSL